MPREVFRINNHKIEPGTRATIDLGAAKLYTHTEMQIPVHVIHGKKDGPVLFVSAALHGDEILGVEIIRRLLKLKFINNLAGTLIAIPVVNVFGFINQSRYSPDRRDLNRFFPGTSAGSLTSQLAKLFMDEVVDQCTHGIDLHTGSNHRVNLPQIRAYLNDPETERLANAFGTPIILDADFLEGSLRQAVHDKGIPILLYEAGEVLRFDEVAIQAGLKGIISVMRAIGMLKQSKQPRKKITPMTAKSSFWMRSPVSGIIRTKSKLGDHVSTGQVLGYVTDPFGEDETPIHSSDSGIIIGKLNLPLVYKGDALFHIARIGAVKKATEAIEAFRQEFEPDL